MAFDGVADLDVVLALDEERRRILGEIEALQHELPEGASEARNLVTANGWDIVIDRERSDVIPVVGQIIRTAPAAGVLLAEGDPFLMVVSEGPTLRELPDSAGATLADAENRLRERGLSKELAARIANAPHPDAPYLDKTYDELYEMAKERDIEGRSNMKKQELIDALKEAE